MRKTPSLEEVEAIIRDVFATPDAVVTRETVASDIEGWDSLSHTILILQLEAGYGVEFPSEEVYSLDNVGELIDRLAQLVEAKGAN
jgi:acyl carrier protein